MNYKRFVGENEQENDVQVPVVIKPTRFTCVLPQGEEYKILYNGNFAELRARLQAIQ